MAKTKKICLIGLGYVGLPLALLCLEKGYKVIGIDTDKKKINLLRKSINPLTNTKISGKLFIGDEVSVRDSDIVIVCVPTPVNEDHSPNLEPLLSASKLISRNLRKDHLIIIESTVSPGILDKYVKPILEKSKLKAGKDFYFAHCPERIDPGNKKWTLSNIPRVVGASSKMGLTKAIKFYKSILDADIMPLSSISIVEAVKVYENTFRDVNIAFVNEMAKTFDKMNLDLMEVISGAKTKPFGFMAHYPSSGVGGHCIPVDPYYLIRASEKSGYSPLILKSARIINNSMPGYTVKKLKAIASKLKGTKVGVLGLAYKSNSSDDRESPSKKIIKILKEEKAVLNVYDPFILGKSNSKSLINILEKSDYLILVTDHNEFKKLNGKLLSKYKIKGIIDGKNFLNKENIKSYGISYQGIGSN